MFKEVVWVLDQPNPLLTEFIFYNKTVIKQVSPPFLRVQVVDDLVRRAHKAMDCHWIAFIEPQTDGLTQLALRSLKLVYGQYHHGSLICETFGQSPSQNHDPILTPNKKGCKPSL